VGLGIIMKTKLDRADLRRCLAMLFLVINL
jgi:hypothetical protein